MDTGRVPFLTMLPALLALALGLSATAALFGWTRGQEQAMEQLIFERRANFRIMTVRRGLDEAVETINDVNRAVTTFTSVSREQFYAFVEPLARGNPYPSSIAFVRMLPHAERAAYEARMQPVVPGFSVRELVNDRLQPASVRERYLVVEYLEPAQVDGLAGLGYDVLSEPYLNQALESAADTGEASGAALFRYLSTPPSPSRFVLVKPVYRAGAQLATSQARRAAVTGYTTIGMPAGEMIAGILDASGMLRTPGVALTVTMGEDGAGKIAYRDPVDTGKDNGVAWPWAGSTTRRQISQSFEVAGVSWRVEVEGSGPASEAGVQAGSWLVALFGAIISVLAALYLWALGSRTRRVHQLVADRTAALHTANAQLSADIAARERVEGMLRRTETELRNSQASLRELGGHQERIKENERKRIAREIHDELGGLLTGIKAYVSVARSRVGDKAAAAPLLAEAMAQADTALDTVRRVIADLRPSVLDQLGVWDAIEWQASQLEAQTGLPSPCFIEPDLPAVGPDGDAMLFRIAQEALTNVARHAQATSVEIRARRDGDGLLLEVEDNGVGIAFDQLSERTTWGLRGMHERAHYLGGSLRLSTNAGGGTLVILRLPLKVNLPEDR